jgi:hypothetical protein
MSSIALFMQYDTACSPSRRYEPEAEQHKGNTSNSDVETTGTRIDQRGSAHHETSAVNYSPRGLLADQGGSPTSAPSSNISNDQTSNFERRRRDGRNTFRSKGDAQYETSAPNHPFINFLAGQGSSRSVPHT